MGGRLFEFEWEWEGGRVGWGWAFIRGWAPIRINTVLKLLLRYYIFQNFKLTVTSEDVLYVETYETLSQ